jgi:hypothetical protein
LKYKMYRHHSGKVLIWKILLIKKNKYKIKIDK